MKLKDIQPEGDNTLDGLITALKARNTASPDISRFKKQLDPKTHDVMDIYYRPNKPIKKERVTKDPTGRTVVEEVDDTEQVNRIALAIQDLIVERAVAFLFGNEPKMAGDIVTEGQKEVVKFIEKIKTANKVEMINRQAARSVFSATEVAEYWFPVPAENYTKYGRTTAYKLRCKLFDPLSGYQLFPLFDNTGDLIAFSVEFTQTKLDSSTTYFWAFTDEEKAVFIKEDHGDWKIESHMKNPIPKLPIVYGRQKEVEWEKVHILIERLEKLLSNFADTNDYHASPKIFIEGILTGFAKKGEAGAILQGEKGSTAKYLSWDHAPESVRLEVETLMGMIFSLTQTPNISFDNVKGLGAMSGIALKLLFLDAHLKVKNKEEIFSPYLQRRNSILSSYAGLLDTSLAEDANAINLYDSIEPYMIDDLKDMVETLVAANGNNPIISQEKSVAISPFSDDPESDYKKIVEETKARNSFDVFERTF